MSQAICFKCNKRIWASKEACLKCSKEIDRIIDKEKDIESTYFDTFELLEDNYCPKAFSHAWNIVK